MCNASWNKLPKLLSCGPKNTSSVFFPFYVMVIYPMVFRNDGHSRLGAEDGLAFGSVHPTASLELVWWLRRTNYTGSVYFDTFPKNEDPVKEAMLNIRRFQKLWELAEKMDEDVKKMQETHDAMAVMEYLDTL